MDIANEIDSMAYRGQKLCSKLENEESEELWREIKKLEGKTTKRFKAIVAMISVPTISKVGKKASYNA